MSRTSLYLLVALLLLIGGSVAGFLVLSKQSVIPENSSDTAGTNVTGQALFSDGEYGFSIRYPQRYATDYTFSTFYHLPAEWRANALPEATGTPILAIIPYRIQSEHSYPRYYDAEVRIGASKDPKEVARCLVVATEQAEQQLPDVMLNGTAFKAFAFQSAGMMQYAKGVSYRTVHNGACIAVEKIAAGSSYRDDPVSSDDVPQATLDAAYTSLDAVVSAFAFTYPV